jgi:hypothetical protein
MALNQSVRIFYLIPRDGGGAKINGLFMTTYCTLSAICKSKQWTIRHDLKPEDELVYPVDIPYRSKQGIYSYIVEGYDKAFLAEVNLCGNE